MVRYTICLFIFLSTQAIGQTVSIGVTSAPQFFEYSRFAYPDLATGGPGCCEQISSDSSSSPALKLSVKRGAIEASASYLGSFRSGFTVSGPFGSALGRDDVSSGSCTESGRFDFYSLTVTGSYKIGRITPKLGVASVFIDSRTKSKCSFQFPSGEEQINRSDQETSSSLTPVVSVSFEYGKLIGSMEYTKPKFGKTLEAKTYGQERIPMFSLWVGYAF